MTKHEAMRAMYNGSKITHKTFTDEEWMKEGSVLDIEFEDECQCSEDDFWGCRTEDIWLTGWTIYVD